jgi:hypothetical protein
MTTNIENHEHLAERHRRLTVAAQAIVENARKADADTALVDAHLLRILMRELDFTPQPSSFATMSIS